MLNEDQARQLVAVCEAGVGHRLDAIKGNLGAAENRAAAIWELIVLDAVLRLGRVEYERPITAGPGSRTVDFYIHVGSRAMWMDATYLSGRFIDNERRGELLLRRFGEEGKVRAVGDRNLWCRLDGEPTADGFSRKLPAQHQLEELFADNRIQDFFNAIQADPHAPVTCDMRPDYTVTFGYDPTGRSWSGGLVEEVPRIIEAHGVYRKLKEKAQQHRGVPGPYVVCVGGDRSPVMRRQGGQPGVTAEQAVGAAFEKWPHLTAVVLVSIEARSVIFEGIKYSARSSVYLNPEPDHPLTPGDLELLKRLDFNRWRYSRPHDPWKSPSSESESRRHSGGSLVYRPLPTGNVEIEIPTWLLLDALRGSANVIDAFGLEDDDHVRRVLTSTWEIAGARLVEGNIAQGDPPRVALEFRPAIGVFRRRPRSEGR